jgi:hypothetical protein
MGVRVRLSGTGIMAASGAMALALSVSVSHAQTPSAPPNPPAAQTLSSSKPVTGFVSSYAILRTARAAGFEPLAPPLRDGTIYVLRATDFRGILMRVVLDARTGAIRDVTRIVPADSDPYEMPPPYGAPPYAPPLYAPPPYQPPPYELPPYAPPPYGASAEYDAPAPPILPPDEGPRRTLARPHPAATRATLPPLPRPRPAAVLAQKSNKAGNGPGLTQSANVQPRSGASANPTGIKAGTETGTIAAPGKTPPPAPLND